MSPIFSIGYGDRNIVDFIRLLEKHGIKYLVDVRSVPYSKFNPQFSKKALEAALYENHISYVFLGDQLGGRPKDKDCYTKDGRVDYDACESKFFYQEGIQRLQVASEGGHPIAIMCSELKPHTCHRSKLIGRTLDKLNIPIQHIDENGELKSQQEVITTYLQEIGADLPIQVSLFGDDDRNPPPLFTSRKSYHTK